MKKLLWFISFFAVLFAGDRLAGFLLQKQTDSSQFRYSRMYRGDAAADILLVGNSRGLTFYQPYIEQITGKKTFNISYNGLPMDAARRLVEDYLEKYPQAKTMVVDITAADRENDELLTGFLTYAAHSQRLDDLIRQKQSKFWWGAQVSWLTRFNNEIFQRAMFHRSKTDEDWMLDRQISEKLATEATSNNYPLDVHENLVSELAAMVAFAKNRGVAVHWVVGPYFPNFQVLHLEDLKNACSAATGLPVRDFRDALPDGSLFGDFMHPNRRGAMAFMDILKREGVLP